MFFLFSTSRSLPFVYFFPCFFVCLFSSAMFSSSFPVNFLLSWLLLFHYPETQSSLPSLSLYPPRLISPSLSTFLIPFTPFPYSFFSLLSFILSIISLFFPPTFLISSTPFPFPLSFPSPPSLSSFSICSWSQHSVSISVNTKSEIGQQVEHKQWPATCMTSLLLWLIWS